MRVLLEELAEELRELKREGVERVRVLRTTLEALEQAALPARGPEAKVEPVPSGASSVAHSTPAPDLFKPILASAPIAPTRVKAVVEKPVSAAAFPPAPAVVLPTGDKDTQYAWLKQRIVDCPVCRAHVKPDKHIVVGSGNLNAPIFFCGEAPGAEEETQGEVFVGPAGQLLVKIIAAMGLKRSDVYIGNIMNWRPEVAVGNRPPSAEEMAFCLPYLKAQIEIVQPKVIVALGNTAIDGLLGHDPARKMATLRGKWQTFEGRALMPTFHPSYLLHNNTNRTKREVWEAMLLVMEHLSMPISQKQRGYFL